VSELRLEIVEGPGSGTIVPLTGPLELGSDPAADVALTDPHVSPRHARVTPAGADGAFVEDLGDPGGTFVNDAEVAAPTRIRPGDEIQLGVTVLELRTAADLDAQGSGVRPTPPPLAVPGQEPGYFPAELDPPKPTFDELEPLLDARTKGKARTAPLALFVLVVFAVLIFLARTQL
jgi:pSer/pThr/pTyr-binding forkhead associated (FHA) protein